MCMLKRALYCREVCTLTSALFPPQQMHLLLQTVFHTASASANDFVCFCSLASAFAQVPVYLRHNVISVTSISNSATSAYTSAAQITLFSNSPVDPDVLIHESAHAQVLAQHLLVVEWKVYQLHAMCPFYC